MIEICKWNGGWRIKIVNETLQFNEKEEFQAALDDLLEVKEEFAPY